MPEPSPARDDEVALLDDDERPDPLRAEVASLRPQDHVEAERLATSIAERMFGISAGPPRIDRFIILERLGTGGTGVVYSAYDPHLDRRVALKLLRDSNRIGRSDHERLLREAHALARIAHPNVVTVHEAGQVGDQVFVVMEVVAGQTLDAWARAGRHGWREVLEVYLQAGRGLAAAHAAGLVHRDFKPHNAIIGEDGRVRVVDFGLARGEWSPTDPDLDAEAPSSRSSSRVPVAGGEPNPLDRLDASLTRPDARPGTPAYMSPEQYGRRPVGPASDQFSFCVALYEALVGTRPFDGDSLDELATSVLAGAVREPPRSAGVPAWLLATLRRGLRVEPGDRYGSMTELLAALTRDPGRGRRRWLWGTGLTALVGTSLGTLLQLAAVEDPCPTSAAAAIAQSWGPTHREALHEHLVSLGSAADSAMGSQLLDGIEDYATRWQGMHEHACRANRRGEQSGVLLDKRMACLSHRRAALDGAIEVLATVDAAAVEDATSMVYDLPPLHPCEDVDVLEAELPPPEDPVVAASVAEARQGLARAATLADAGRLAAARALAEGWVARARELGHRPLVAEALLAQGRIEMEHDTSNGSRPATLLHEAFIEGLSVEHDAVAAEARVRWLWVEAIRLQGRPLREDEDYPLVRALLERVPEPSALQALFLHNAGSIAASRGDFEAARHHFAQALAAWERDPEPHPIEQIQTRFNAALVTLDEAEQREGLAAVAAGLEQRLGPHHRRTLMARRILARSLADPRLALQRYEGLCEAYERHHPDDRDELAACLYDRGLRLVDLHEPARAIASLEHAAKLLPAYMGAPLRVRRALAQGHALLARGRPGAAVTTVRVVLERLANGSPQPPWMETSMAELHVLLGVALVADGRPHPAIDVLAPAVETLARVAALRVDHAIGRTLREARTTLAQASAASPPGEKVPVR